MAIEVASIAPYIIEYDLYALNGRKANPLAKTYATFKHRVRKLPQRIFSLQVANIQLLLIRIMRI